jgi:hypothetical protein
MPPAPPLALPGEEEKSLFQDIGFPKAATERTVSAIWQYIRIMVASKY